MEWIAVKERLPEQDGLYIIYAPSGNPDSPLVIAIRYIVGEGWYGLVDCWLDAITHWMEIEEPVG